MLYVMTGMWSHAAFLNLHKRMQRIQKLWRTGSVRKKQEFDQEFSEYSRL